MKVSTNGKAEDLMIGETVKLTKAYRVRGTQTWGLYSLTGAVAESVSPEALMAWAASRNVRVVESWVS